jgi:mono/diheme cytochrome c family protein
MNRSFSAVAYGVAIAAGAVLFAIGPFGRQGGQSPVAAAEQQAPAPSAVSANGATLRSINLDFPDSNRMFEGLGAEVVNTNCLACHSAGMVLTQPRLSRVAWQAEVEKMRNTYKAPVDAADVPAIIDYLATLPR